MSPSGGPEKVRDISFAAESSFFGSDVEKTVRLRWVVTALSVGLYVEKVGLVCGGTDSTRGNLVRVLGFLKGVVVFRLGNFLSAL